MRSSVKFDRVKIAAEMARNRYGVTELAHKAGLGRTVTSTAKNEKPIGRKSAEKIASALNVPLAALLMN